MKIALHALGCRANQAEIEELKETLGQKWTKFDFVDFRQAADIYVINSCSVTAGAERDTRRFFNKIKNNYPQAKIYALGCLREDERQNQNIDGYFKDWQEFLRIIKIPQYFPKQTISKDNSATTKSFIKIQDGCDFNCSFCLTKILRGPSRSYPPKKIIQRLWEKEKQGKKEVVLTGINILLYDYKGLNFNKLIEKILKETSLPRIRFGSFDPRLLNDEIIKLWQNPRLMPHLHLSVQSGSQNILRTMKRPICLDKISEQLWRFRKINPLFAFSCDMIIGFPGEKESNFQKSLNFLRNNDFFKVHAFPYSDRPGASARTLDKKISEQVKKNRMKRILAMDKQLRKKWQNKMLGKQVFVLWEKKKNTSWRGYTENFLKIQKNSDKNLTGEMEKIKLRQNNLFTY